MRQAFVLLGIMSAIVYAGAFFAFHKKAETPVVEEIATTTINSESIEK